MILFPQALLYTLSGIKFPGSLSLSSTSGARHVKFAMLFVKNSVEFTSKFILSLYPSGIEPIPPKSTKLIYDKLTGTMHISGF
ncbi:uncharacterized protein N7518_009050 [Penicillium psychrosexuale]|uniref:uncharacterized protein n=1 Tax=Penicillium psychrosexuale TaxID=1002107 RepID=UPI0025450D2B|nr:uncharacterized protein N7518_009050 [Penicillium psychrosexuale]KAJ5783373.1 hypothetical protein N7518_009050 [Penicillium psychrosexuale]